MPAGLPLVVGALPFDGNQDEDFRSYLWTVKY